MENGEKYTLPVLMVRPRTTANNETRICQMCSSTRTGKRFAGVVKGAGTSANSGVRPYWRVSTTTVLELGHGLRLHV